MAEAPTPAHRGTGDARGFSVVLIGMSVAVWWPAFTLGAWGELFFDQLLTVWVIATVGLVIVAAHPGERRRRWPRIWALSIPTLWLVLAFIDQNTSADLVSIMVTLLGLLVGIIGVPFTVWTLIGLMWPDLFSQLRTRARVGVFSVVIAVAVVSFVLGTVQEHFLTCADFEVSGNSRPPGCVTPPDE
ncbi:MAG: hypothetical protein ACTHZW_09885 [Microbacteriaceae bacterium]